jgi:hypothetical protein
VLAANIYRYFLLRFEAYKDTSINQYLGKLLFPLEGVGLDSEYYNYPIQLFIKGIQYRLERCNLTLVSQAPLLH